MADASLEGTFTAMVTPFRDGALDEAAVRALALRQVAAGNGLVPCGTTGETPTLSAEEHLRVVELSVEAAAGQVPVIAGAGSHGTERTMALAKRCAELGANALMLVCPYYNRPTQAGLEAHFRAVAEAVDLPVMLYNVPGRTGVDLALATTLRLAEVPNIVGIKEASGNVLRGQAILAHLRGREVPGGFRVFAGDDGLMLPVVAVGGSGVVSVTANRFPKAVGETVRAALDGRWDEAREAHLRLLPVHDAMFLESNPIPIKALMHDADLLAPEIRLPMTWAQPATLAEAKARIAQAGLEDER